jgi:hypothetical protein
MASDVTEAERDLNGLLSVRVGGAQLRLASRGLCTLCQPGGRCRQLVRLSISDDEGGQVFAARRHCDGQAVFAAVPMRVRPVSQIVLGDRA